MSRNLVSLGSLLVVAVLAVPSSADWLVTKDGARIETAGPWKVKGNQVIFTLTNGTLSSLRASEVDLDASAVATAKAKMPAPPPAVEAEKPRPAPVLVLTDKDIGRAAAVPAEGGEKKEGEEDESSLSDEQTGSVVEVVGWQTRDSAEGDGLELYGTLRNNGGAIASSIELVVDVRDAEGKSLLETTAFLDSQTLVPGKATAFRALLPGLTSINGEPRFKVKSNEVTLAPAKPLPEGSEAEGELIEPGSG